MPLPFSSFVPSPFPLPQTRARNSLDDVFRSFYAYNPKLVINRPKFHAFVHLLTDIRRFGPAKFISNEWSESFNRPVRDALQNTNRLFPSRDLASHFGDVERALFLFRGGIWRTAEGEERQAGRRILEDFEDGVLRKLMGYGKRDEALPGAFPSSFSFLFRLIPPFLQQPSPIPPSAPGFPMSRLTRLPSRTNLNLISSTLSFLHLPSLSLSQRQLSATPQLFALLSAVQHA